MKILVWVLAGIAAVALLGGVVLPVVAWLLHTLGWVVAGVLVVGGGVWVTKKISEGRAKEKDGLVTGRDGQRLP